jgi:hypothetical protein
MSEKHLRELSKKAVDNAIGLARIVSVQAELIKSMREIRNYI